MDPIRTAVKYSLIPLRTIVQLGELYLAAGQQPERRPGPVTDSAPAPAPAPAPRKKAAARPKPSPQASARPKDLDDVGLARKVETIIFRDESVPKGDIDVNAADGVVWLRGTAKTPEMIKALEQQTAAIPEVRQVENLLHLPKTPAPTRTDTPPTQRRTRSTTKRPSAARKVTTAVTEERQQPSPARTNGSGENGPGGV
jgi:hypothetical protein